MTRICYTPKTFSPAAQGVIDAANTIIEEYQDQGFTLTLRQLYYQFVARGMIPNSDKEYKYLGGLVSDARRAGQIDWTAIEDRTRFLRSRTHWDSPAQILKAAATGYHRDRWAGQKHRLEVWIEKDALIGVIEDICNELDMAFFSCRGYASDSELWRAARRIEKYNKEQGQIVGIVHLGDHDPSGLDMTRDIGERLGLFLGWEKPYPIFRLALSMKQVRQYEPPPNPAKLSDSRCRRYVEEYDTDQSWELDALDPKVIAGLIQKTAADIIDKKALKAAVTREKQEQNELMALARNRPRSK